MEHLARIPQDRIAVLIGKGGETRRMLEEACGATLEIDSKNGEVMADWGEGSVDPIVRMKMPDVIVAIGRGLAPKRAVQLIQDEVFLKMYDIREWVGKQPNQTRRMRSRLIGRNGRIRSLIEEISRCELAIYGSTVLVIGDEDGIALAAPAIEGILRGSEHSTILHGLEQDRKRQRLRSRRLESYEGHSTDESSTFETLVPGLAEARRRRERRFKDSQVDPEDEEEVSSILDLADDEEIVYEEE
ncbi:MAG: KH domain-containing protein [Candidatus Poseidoniales archaeon]|nr:KH domain-containing protein [Candidatus Poseidoniales archaeon]